MGTVEEPLNGSKGCGGVMRVAPVGLIGNDPFQLGCETAAVTHGHPTGYLAAGALALMINRLVHEEKLGDAVQAALAELRQHKGHEETSNALQHALRATGAGSASPERIEELGQGWVAEEALAIAVYAAIMAGKDFASGLRLAVNHSGDSDSAGAIAGNILGTMLGVEAIPERWLASLELRDEITALADDLLTGYRNDDAWRHRYPGW